MTHFRIAQIAKKDPQSGADYVEFVRELSMSVGVYRLHAGASDPQQPHEEDEVYHVIRGKGQIEVAGESETVGPGSVVFVRRLVPHRFHSIEEDLEILVFFSPAEASGH